MKKLKPNPLRKANILSRLTFWWLNGLFREGSKRNLQESDMFEVDTDDKSHNVCDKLERNWNEELENLASKSKTPSLIRAVARTYRKKLAIYGLLALFEESLRIVSPLLVYQLTKYFENIDTTPVWKAYVYSAAIGITSFTVAFSHHFYFHRTQIIGSQMRVAICAMMYKKTLRLSQKSLNETSVGKIVNLGATDVIRFDLLPTYLNYLWIAPLQILVVGILLWQEVGISVLAGLFVLFIFMLIHAISGDVFGKLRQDIFNRTKTAHLTDNRTRLTNEVISGMRILKMYVWEKPFAKMISETRRKEINKILQSAVVKAFYSAILLCQDKVLTFVTIALYVTAGGTVEASKILVVVGLFISLRFCTATMCPLAIQFASESVASLNRIQHFLQLDEVSPLNHSLPEQNAQVELKDFYGKWNEGSGDHDKSDPTLKAVCARVNSGQLLAVIGPVGAGKSSFLHAILRELPIIGGEITIKGTIVFSNQIPWIFSGTVRDNILFGEPFDAAWYKKVVYACCLTKDLTMLPDGDKTLVGERGVMLSGGQKTRVNLARAAYRRNADIVLLDDPLSAVDPAVSKHIFDHCITGILKNKVRVLVTHQLHFLKDADQIIILNNGEVADHGTYDELQANGTDFASALEKRKTDKVPDVESGFSRNFARKSLRASMRSQVSLYPMEEEEEEEEETHNVGNGELSEMRGSKRNVYIEYICSGGNYLLFLLFALIYIASFVLYVANDWWLARWSAKYESFQLQSGIFFQNEETTALHLLDTNTTEPYGESSSMRFTNMPTSKNLFEMSGIDNETESFDNFNYLIIYAGVNVTLFLITLLLTNMHFYLCVVSGIRMHEKMFRALLRAPIRFFDINPAGRILNRFSKDMGQIDELLPNKLGDFLFTAGIILSLVIFTSVVNYFVIIIVIPLAVYFIWLRRYFLRSSKDIKHLEGSCRSPVFNLLSSTLNGLLTVRAFSVQDQFINKFHEAQDLHSASWFLFVAGTRWFGFRLDLIAAIFVTSVAFLCVVASSLLNLNPGDIGLTITYSISMMSLFQFGVQQSAEVENMMTSVERVRQYHRLEPEAPEEVPEREPIPGWPVFGEIYFKNVSFAYYENGPTVLKNVSFRINSTEKVGLVGRTGAGKSSLISALFRLSELSKGEIFIDGVAISSLGLRDLRNALSIIPQDPVLFVGSMRRNLDPFDIYTDEELWDAIEQAQLKKVVQALPQQLDTELAEAGSNFSVGQRQLVCLARAILRRCKVIVIDEATANVDVQTDRLIQMTIREKFRHCTVVTIAHRINTIIDSDKVMVLDGGELKEFSEPYLLLQNKNGYFSKMVGSAGIDKANALRFTAKNVYEGKHGIKNKDTSYSV